MHTSKHTGRLQRFLLWAGCAVLCSASLSVCAEIRGLNLSKTRVIFKAQEGQATVNVNNTSSQPYLVMSRISRTTEGREGSPLFVSPPLFRLDGRSSNVLRITGDTHQLPPDRESVFYLNVSGIPKSNPLSRDNSSGYVSGHVAYSVGNIIKVFYRPSGLVSSADEAANQVVFTRMGASMQASNPSPYYVSFVSLTLNGRSVKFGSQQPGMIPPFGNVTYRETRAFPMSQAGKVEWQTVNDLGGLVKGQGTVQ